MTWSLGNPHASTAKPMQYVNVLFPCRNSKFHEQSEALNRLIHFCLNKKGCADIEYCSLKSSIVYLRPAADSKSKYAKV